MEVVGGKDVEFCVCMHWTNRGEALRGLRYPLN